MVDISYFGRSSSISGEYKFILQLQSGERNDGSGRQERLEKKNAMKAAKYRGADSWKKQMKKKMKSRRDSICQSASVGLWREDHDASKNTIESSDSATAGKK